MTNSRTRTTTRTKEPRGIHRFTRAAAQRSWRRVLILVLGTGLCSFESIHAQDTTPLGSLLPEIPQRDYLAGDYDGIRTRLYAQGIDLFANYQGEVFGNVSGGSMLDSLGQTRNVASYDGLLTLGVNLDLGKLFGWPGAKIYFSVLEMQGTPDDGPSDLL